MFRYGGEADVDVCGDGGAEPMVKIEKRDCENEPRE